MNKFRFSSSTGKSVQQNLKLTLCLFH